MHIAEVLKKKKIVGVVFVVCEKHGINFKGKSVQKNYLIQIFHKILIFTCYILYIKAKLCAIMRFKENKA